MCLLNGKVISHNGCYAREGFLSMYFHTIVAFYRIIYFLGYVIEHFQLLHPTSVFVFEIELYHLVCQASRLYILCLYGFSQMPILYSNGFI